VKVNGHVADFFFKRTAEFSYQGKEYCISMSDWKVKGLKKIKIKE